MTIQEPMKSREENQVDKTKVFIKNKKTLRILLRSNSPDLPPPQLLLRFAFPFPEWKTKKKKQKFSKAQYNLIVKFLRFFFLCLVNFFKIIWKILSIFFFFY